MDCIINIYIILGCILGIIVFARNFIFHPVDDSYKRTKQFSNSYREDLVRNATPADICLKNYLYGKIYFKFQHVIDKYRGWKLDGFYVADFYFPDYNLIVELDGGYHNDPSQKEKDSYRTWYLRKNGYHVVRFTNEQILESKNLDWILDIIKQNR